LERVDESASVVFERADVPFTAANRERFLAACAIRKVWLTVRSQYWTVTAVFKLMDRFDLRETAIGSARYGPGTAQFEAIVRLHREMRDQLAELELSPVAFAGSLSEVAQEVS
jgi:hypothetical protein